ncbi:hypothetical protein NDN16_10510 [Aureimonas altamirensis]|uniref:hypothetical protein n=1 Tax=Aureimonas altamirensis TaxID=370622 RepID=UPI0020375B71|nr:hypothetical protein [Aureimonas altamirensis]MCM2504103.1 hypothetical protein [Aureimonas altamirensis]
MFAEFYRDDFGSLVNPEASESRPTPSLEGPQAGALGHLAPAPACDETLVWETPVSTNNPPSTNTLTETHTHADTVQETLANTLTEKSSARASIHSSPSVPDLKDVRERADNWLASQSKTFQSKQKNRQTLIQAQEALSTRWRDLSGPTRANALTRACMAAGETYPFTLNLNPATEKAALASGAPHTYLAKRITRHLKPILGEPLFWIVTEQAQNTDRSARLHVHGCIRADEETLPAVREALRKAGGEWEQHRQFQAHILKDAPDFGWHEYVSKETKTFAAPLIAKQRAQAIHDGKRARRKAYRDPAPRS